MTLLPTLSSISVPVFVRFTVKKSIVNRDGLMTVLGTVQVYVVPEIVGDKLSTFVVSFQTIGALESTYCLVAETRLFYDFEANLQGKDLSCPTQSQTRISL